MTDNLFTQTNTPDPIDQNKNYLEELVGDGRKFKDPEALAKGKAESDSYIKILERQMDEMRAENERARTELLAGARLQELIDQAKSSNLNSPVTNNPPVNVENQPNIKMEDIESLFSNKILEHENAKKERDNFNSVLSKLKDRYGDNYQSTLNEQAETLGLKPEDVNFMAKKQPNVLIKALGLDQKPQDNSFHTPPRSSQRNDNFAPRGQEKRTWAYYQDMRKKNPGLFNDPQTNIQMQKDYMDLGAAFEDGDFHA